MLAAAALLAGLVAAHHSGLEMASTHHDGMSPAAMTMCLAAFAAVGAAVVAVAFGVVSLGRWRLVALAAPGTRELLDAPDPSARAGPGQRSLLGVWRQ